MKVRFNRTTKELTFLDGTTTLNSNDVLWHTLEVELEGGDLLPNEHLFVAFSKVDGSISTQGDLQPKEGVYHIPQEVLASAGEWTLQILIRVYDAVSGSYIQRGASNKGSFSVEEGLHFNGESNPVTINSLGGVKTDLSIAQENIAKLSEEVAASITDLQGMDAAISETASTALEKVNKAEKDIFQLQVGFGAVSALGGELNELEDKVANAKASQIEVSVDPLTFITTFKLLGDGGAVISTAEIDLPLESMVVDAKYNPAAGGAIVLTLQSGSIIAIPVADIVRGLIPSSEKGIANGVASLDSNGKVPKEQLPEDIGSGGGVSEERVGELIDEKIGDIETALDSVIAIQNSLVGGGV